MKRLTAQGRTQIDELAERHGFSNEAVTHMLFAVSDGNAGMAMFDHREFGGPGQWMRGGMLMLSDASDRALEGRVDDLCDELAQAFEAQPALIEYVGAGQRVADSPPSDANAEPPRAEPATAGGAAPGDGGAGAVGGAWWPAAYGAADATGDNGRLRYAYFARAQRLAIDDGERVSLHDTDGHRIEGISQTHNGDTGTTRFFSQHGGVDLDSLPCVSQGRGAGDSGRRAPGPSRDACEKRPRPAGADVFTAIERLGDLKAKGLLTEDEFAAKKIELLARI